MVPTFKAKMSELHKPSLSLLKVKKAKKLALKKQKL